MTAGVEVVVNGRKRPSLSSKSLMMCWEWAENNEGNALADWYMAACVVVGREWWDAAAAVGLKPDYSRPRRQAFEDEGCDAWWCAVQTRDNIGRLVLRAIKREKEAA